MAFLENGIFCSAEEYKRDKERRLGEADLRIEDLYAMALLLDSNKREAAKIAVRLLAKSNSLIEVAFLDKEFNTLFTAEQAITDGLMHDFTDTTVHDNANGGSYPIQQAFLKDYFEDQFGSILSESMSLSV